MKKADNSIFKNGQKTRQVFHKRGYPNGNKHMKRCSTSLGIREMQIKTRKRYLYIPTRMAKISSAGEDAEQMELAYTAGGDAKWYCHSGKQFGRFL